MFKDTPAFSSFSVDDIEKAKQFYGQTLGLEFEEISHMAMPLIQLKLAGGGEVMIYPKPNHQPATYTVLNFRVDNIGDAVDQLAKNGVQFESYQDGPVKTDEKGIARGQTGYGPSSAWFKDPAGNILAVMEDN